MRSTPILCCAVLYISTSVSAQENPSPIPENTVHRGVLEGQVTNAVTGSPVKRAEITISDGESRSGKTEFMGAVTDLNGRFSVRNLPPGSYQVWAERNGFQSQYFGAQTPQTPGTLVTLQAGQEIPDVNLKLIPNAAVAGRILDEDGEILQGAMVQALRLSYWKGRRQLQAMGWATSDDKGEYRIYNLPPGRYYLAATRAGSPSRRPYSSPGVAPKSTAAFAPAFFPGTLELTRAALLPLAAGSEARDTDIRLPAVRTAAIRGQVILPAEGASIGQLQLVLTYRDGLGIVGQTGVNVNNLTGRFEMFGIPPGSYVLVASSSSQGHSFRGRRQIDVGGDDLEGVTISLAGGIEITGQITLDGSTDQTNAHPQIWLSPRDNMPASPAPVAVMNKDLSFRLENVMSGDWILEVGSLPENSYVSGVQLGSKELSNAEVPVDSGISQPIHILISTSGGQISGTVQNDSVKHAPTVVLVPDGDRRRSAALYKVIAADDKGQFQMKGIAPGAYKIFAFEEITAAVSQDVDFLRAIDNLGESIVVGENERLTKNLSLIPAATTLAHSLSGDL